MPDATRDQNTRSEPGTAAFGWTSGKKTSMTAPEGPDRGHTFRIVVSSRMSSRVVGDAHHVDADWEGPAMTLDVRAWSLRAALRRAARMPLSAWTIDGEDERNPAVNDSGVLS